MGERAVSCENIGPKQRQFRFLGGLASIVAACGLGMLFFALNIGPVLYVLLFLPFANGFISIFESRQGVCTLLAIRGVENPDSHFLFFRGRKIPEADSVRQLRMQAWEIVHDGALLAAIATAGFVLLAWQ